MGRIGRIGVVRAFAPRRDGRRHDLPAREPKSNERALVSVEQLSAARAMIGEQGDDAGFIAQLVATRSGVLQTRRLRRAAPIEAAHSYGEMLGRIALSHERAGQSWRA